MFIIGVTGSIGSGKSTISRLLADISGAPVIDADKIARELVEPGREALVSIVETFGNNMICEDGTLNRKKLGALIFTNTIARERLNKIMFPLIREKALHYFNFHTIQKRKFAIYDAPLLFDSGTNDLVDYTVVVYASREVQIERIKERNKLTEEEATARVDAQQSGDELLAKPMDYLIRNEKSFIELNGVISGLWKTIQQNNHWSAK